MKYLIFLSLIFAGFRSFADLNSLVESRPFPIEKCKASWKICVATDNTFTGILGLNVGSVGYFRNGKFDFFSAPYFVRASDKSIYYETVDASDHPIENIVVGELTDSIVDSDSGVTFSQLTVNQGNQLSARLTREAINGTSEEGNICFGPTVVRYDIWYMRIVLNSKGKVSPEEEFPIDKVTGQFPTRRCSGQKQ